MYMYIYKICCCQHDLSHGTQALDAAPNISLDAGELLGKELAADGVTWGSKPGKLDVFGSEREDAVW